ncbi:UDP-2,3-diacylglucosamine hydrolase [Youhaiella tibetensis]|uniref:UDP-2,3-diacylglucosamine diphosphatase n=1 Tax=Paradevosia tibetensis TaxID=1447062 RepID=A0A5B9DQD0_9HYPH|nr:UDP-2,3-diacylglucosamine diphosphatase [Youhaiella tibetensis]AKR56241.1 serine/threonine protein phosphatase [Devosia sp. H5989]QEE21296.1 UDP-2,3-diacylglucosamine diphosphatase [Youhaiella tibetensis]GGF16210.1 UDP-2,3-diacylglucosamine hydrolase [Youhaiella tibetensis]
MAETREVRRVRALFISDVHLGMRPTRVGQLIEFLRYHDAETIYLVGDILDGWRLAKSWHWPNEYNVLTQILLDKAAAGAKVIYLPGNHDEFLREYLGTYFGEVEFVDRTVHTTAQGKTYLVIHGDQFDVVVRHAKWLAYVGDWAYRFALRVNIVINWVRRRLGLTYWSLSAWAKHKVKNAVSVIGRFEEALSLEARQSGVDGVICGHIHYADMHDRLGIHYINTGDWVESCTAIVENADGAFELIKWTGIQQEGRRFRRRKEAT